MLVEALRYHLQAASVHQESAMGTHHERSQILQLPVQSQGFSDRESLLTVIQWPVLSAIGL